MQINVGTTPGQVAEAVIEVDANGNPIQDVSTYAVTINDVTPVATATDVLQIIGSATKTISITSIRIAADANSATELDFYVYKRSAANTGGTASNPTVVKYDSLNPTQSATVKLYSANPSALGAGALLCASQFIVPPTAGNNGIPIMPLIFTFGGQTSQPVVLRGVNESISISMNGQTIPAGLGLYVTIEWTEQ